MSEAWWQTPTQDIHFSDGHPLQPCVCSELFVKCHNSSTNRRFKCLGEFLPNIYSVDAYFSQDEGMVTGSGDNFSYNDDVSLTALPKNGKEFLRWQVVRSNTYNVALGASSYDSTLSKITIDGRESPTISLIRGHTYEFDVQLEDDNFSFSQPVNIRMTHMPMNT